MSAGCQQTATAGRVFLQTPCSEHQRCVDARLGECEAPGEPLGASPRRLSRLPAGFLRHRVHLIKGLELLTPSSDDWKVWQSSCQMRYVQFLFWDLGLRSLQARLMRMTGLSRALVTLRQL